MSNKIQISVATFLVSLICQSCCPQGDASHEVKKTDFIGSGSAAFKKHPTFDVDDLEDPLAKQLKLARYCQLNAAKHLTGELINVELSKFCTENIQKDHSEDSD